jgi:hypothetical protein
VLRRGRYPFEVNTRHFGAVRPLPNLELTRLVRSLLSCWTTLESFILQASIGRPLSPISLAGQSNLRQIDVCPSGLLDYLPATLDSVTLNGYIAVQPDTVPAADSFTTRIADNLAAVAPQLLELSLHGSSEGGPNIPRRGHHHRLIASLRDVRRLSIPAFAVADLAHSLVRLARLAELSVSDSNAHAASARAVGFVEVLCLLLDAPALRKLSLAASIVSGWTAEGRRAVKEVARRKGIQLVDLGG